MVKLQPDAMFIEMEAEIKLLRLVLGKAREKLEFYRDNHSGEYVGGMEYTGLMALIADVSGDRDRRG